MRKKKLYVVGYDGDNQCVYGKDRKDSYGNNNFIWCDPMTAYDAKKKFKSLKDKGGVIYKLIPVNLKNTKKG